MLKILAVLILSLFAICISIPTRYLKAKIEGATIVKSLGELKDALGIAREG